MRKTNERRKLEKELLYYLQLYNELIKRENAKEVCKFYAIEIDRLVELLKEL